MVSVPSPFGGDDDDAFDAYDEFVPENVPVPGEFLDGHDVLAGRPHLAFHRLSRALFEERAVYDMTFGYNLARLNCDPRHRDAGYRYAVECPDAVERPDAVDGTETSREAGTVGEAESDDEADRPAVSEDAHVLRAEFTPTTPFCPQSDTLTKGSFRAWNGLSERHEYDLVRVRVAPMHQRSAVINDQLRDLEREFWAAGELPESGGDGADPGGSETHQDRARAAGRDGSRAPF